MLLKETVYDKLVAKVNAIPLTNIDTSDFVINVTDFVKKEKLK